MKTNYGKQKGHNNPTKVTMCNRNLKKNNTKVNVKKPQRMNSKRGR